MRMRVPRAARAALKLLTCYRGTVESGVLVVPGFAGVVPDGVVVVPVVPGVVVVGVDGSSVMDEGLWPMDDGVVVVAGVVVVRVVPTLSGQLTLREAVVLGDMVPLVPVGVPVVEDVVGDPVVEDVLVVVVAGQGSEIVERAPPTLLLP